MNKFRVFWAGANIAGHYQFLHDEFIRLGFESHLLVGSNKFQYKKVYKDKSLATKIYQYINVMSILLLYIFSGHPQSGNRPSKKRTSKS